MHHEIEIGKAITSLIQLIYKPTYGSAIHLIGLLLVPCVHPCDASTWGGITTYQMLASYTIAILLLKAGLQVFLVRHASCHVLSV